MMRVKSSAEADRLAGRAPAPVTPPAPVPEPAPAPATPAGPVVDHEARALIRATADQLRALSELIVMQVQQPAPPPAYPAPPPAPPAAPAPAPEPVAPAPLPAPPAPRFIGMPTRPPQEVAKPLPGPAPAPAPDGPIEATIQRDHKDRLKGVRFTGSATTVATIARDSKDRMQTITITRAGQPVQYTVRRGKGDRITSITPAHPHKAP